MRLVYAPGLNDDKYFFHKEKALVRSGHRLFRGPEAGECDADEPHAGHLMVPVPLGRSESLVWN